MEKLKKRNLKFLFFGYFFYFTSGILISFFLPYYLKDGGMSILQIGALLTAGLALGNLVMGYGFGRLMGKIKLKTGLYVSAFFSFLYSFIFYIFPNSLGIIGSKLSGEIGNVTHKVSTDVTMQHNIYEKGHRDVSVIHLITDSISIIVGLFLGIFLLKYFDFRTILLVFALIALPAFFFYSKIKEDTRFKSKKKNGAKIGKRLTLLFLAENLFWFAMAASFTLVITFLISDKFSAPISWIAYLFGGLYVSITITSILTKKFLNDVNFFKSSIAGMLIIFIATIIIILSKNVFVLLGALALEGIGAGIWVPSKTAAYWKETNPELRERASGSLMGFRTFGKALGPLAGGLLVTWWGISSPFYFRSLICLTSILIYIYLLKTK